MSGPLKHIGKLKNTGSKVVIVFRTVPGESDRALVLEPANLPDSYHDSLMKLLESQQGQDSYEFGEIMFTRTFPDGRNMLASCQQDNRLKKMPTDIVIMTPTTSSEIALDQLNLIIAEQKNCTVDDLCTFVSGGPKLSDNKSKPIKTEEKSVEQSAKIEAPINEVLSDKDIARGYRSQADALYKEAARLRKQADELDPPQKKTQSKIKDTADA
jgi:hypothetical protein